MKLISYEILDHGMDHNQYFQGCGTAFTNFTHVWTGAGNSSKEAYNDALDQAYMDIGDLADKFQKRPAGFTLRPTVPQDSEDVYFYVSIRARIQEEKK
jgi:hypothetical protein